VNVDDVRNDPVLQLLKTLPPADIDAARAAHIRHRCHGALRRQDRRAAIDPGRVFEPAAVVAMCAIYLSEVARRALLLLD
jgi:hypothetical protein